MGSRFGHALRAILSTIVALAVWLVLATPAWAGEDRDTEGGGRLAAPQCDTRGATTFAPAPTLDPPKASIDAGGDADEGCAALTALETFRSGAPTDESPPVRTDAVVPRLPIVPCAASEALARVRVHLDETRPGVCSTFERPPR